MTFGRQTAIAVNQLKHQTKILTENGGTANLANPGGNNPSSFGASIEHSGVGVT